jgi:DNA mismatch repair ATPase MutS
MISKPVVNDLCEEKSVLLTGSNASGKSTFLKTIAINAILAQTINTCTAKKYEAGFFKVYTSMSLRDDLLKNDSYFMVEIKAIKRIIDEMNEDIPILCFVDEVLRGTNTIERISASSHILKYISGGNAFCFAATHDIELTNILEDVYSNYHFTEKVVEDDVIFNYKLNKGKATSKNAIKLLRLLKISHETILKELEMSEKEIKQLMKE